MLYYTGASVVTIDVVPSTAVPGTFVYSSRNVSGQIACRIVDPAGVIQGYWLQGGFRPPLGPFADIQGAISGLGIVPPPDVAAYLAGLPAAYVNPIVP